MEVTGRQKGRQEREEALLPLWTFRAASFFALCFLVALVDSKCTTLRGFLWTVCYTGNRAISGSPCQDSKVSAKPTSLLLELRTLTVCNLDAESLFNLKVSTV
jgi:hypothetical protein